jgi:hypothetical protein
LNPVRKARRAGALYEGRSPGIPQWNPGVRHRVRCKAFLVEGREGNLRRGDDVSGGWDEGEPERSKGPGEQGPRPGVNTRGARKGYGFSGGMKPLKRRCEVVRFRREAQERRGEGKPSYDPLRGGKL